MRHSGLLIASQYELSSDDGVVSTLHSRVKAGSAVVGVQCEEEGG